MSRDPRHSCRFAALALGMQAKLGPVYRPEVAALVLQAVLLEEGDPLAAACITFARGACEVPSPGGKLAQLGDALIRDVERSTWPDASDRDASEQGHGTGHSDKPWHGQS